MNRNDSIFIWNLGQFKIWRQFRQQQTKHGIREEGESGTEENTGKMIAHEMEAIRK